MTLIRGWLILDKPEGISSAALVSKVKRKFPKIKIGHAGTLDPLASGILPLALGEATKVVSYVMTDIKTYRFEVVWGESRTTDDPEGDIIETNPHRPTVQDIENALPTFMGEILQRPPAFSAMKIDGQRAYALARRGEEVDLPPRPVQVYDLQMMGQNESGDASVFQVRCGAGFYVRSLARDLALFLGTCAHARHIRRIQVGKFHEKDALTLEKLEILDQMSLIREYMRSVESVLDDIPALSFAPLEEENLTKGQGVRLCQALGNRHKDVTEEMVLLCVNGEGKLFALARCVDGFVKPHRILKY
jgi:tRNA pseudouridine55 synthase